jgi:hypothetical protein
VIHWTHKGCCPAALPTATVLAIRAPLPAATMPLSVPLTLALPWTLALALILITLRVAAEIPFATPLFPVVSRVVRVVGCIIHLIFYLILWCCRAPNAEILAWAKPVHAWITEVRLSIFREIFVFVSALARASRTGTGGNLKTL